jgi:starvation-inducible DNA-binding protein
MPRPCAQPEPGRGHRIGPTNPARKEVQRTETVALSPAIPPTEYSTTETVDMMTTRIYAVVDTIRTVHDAVDAADPSTVDLLHTIIDALEKQAWMLKSENRKA